MRITIRWLEGEPECVNDASNNHRTFAKTNGIGCDGCLLKFDFGMLGTRRANISMHKLE